MTALPLHVHLLVVDDDAQNRLVAVEMLSRGGLKVLEAEDGLQALDLLPASTSAQVVDLGTGSGAVALALKAQRPGWTVHALDASADAVGGKAWQLAQLRRYGLPVAEFIVLPAAAAAPTDEAEHAWAAVQARGWADKPLAVRSSAVGEDGAHASFAGIHRSCLNVCGAAQLAEAIAAVRASLLSDSARAYRQRLGIAGQARMAVIIMPLLPAVAEIGMNFGDRKSVV